MNATMLRAKAGVTDFQENMEAMKHNFLLRGYFKSRGYEDSAELGKNEIEELPQSTPTKEFTYSAKQLFDKQDSAKLKNQKSLNAGGEFCATMSSPLLWSWCRLAWKVTLRKTWY